MAYNLHPIFVHFPIALLAIYSVLKLLPLERWFPKVAWKDLELAFLALGLLGAFAALATGDAAEHLTRPNRQLVNAHATLAEAATWLYGALLAGELAAYLNAKVRWEEGKLSWLRHALRFVEGAFANPAFSALLALAALACVSIAGLFGGVMVYGTSADPFAQLFLNLFGIKL